MKKDMIYFNNLEIYETAKAYTYYIQQKDEAFLIIHDEENQENTIEVYGCFKAKWEELENKPKPLGFFYEYGADLEYVRLYDIVFFNGIAKESRLYEACCNIAEFNLDRIDHMIMVVLECGAAMEKEEEKKKQKDQASLVPVI